MNKPVFRVYKSVLGSWCWELRAANGAVIAVCAKPYPRKRNAVRALNAVYMAIFEAGEASK
jgi:uncharacterized protein YegP (UPF0339 family)